MVAKFASKYDGSNCCSVRDMTFFVIFSKKNSKKLSLFCFQF